MNKTAIVIGATGLVGSQLVQLLIEDKSYSIIKVFTRRTIGIESAKLDEYIVDFDEIDRWKDKLTGNVLFSTMGTTISKAGGKEQQYLIDYTYQFEIAKAAADSGVNKYVLVSSLGANAGSRIFYSKMKGELDEAVQKLPFKNVYIVRPSALVGQRSEERAGEKVMIRVTSFFVKLLPFLKKYKPISAKTVAKAMINLAAKEKETGSQIINNDQLFELAKS